MKYTCRDLRSQGHCISGTKAFCEKHGIDYREFLKNGIDVEILRAVDDPIAVSIVNYADNKAKDEGRG